MLVSKSHSSSAGVGQESSAPIGRRVEAKQFASCARVAPRARQPHVRPDRQPRQESTGQRGPKLAQGQILQSLGSPAQQSNSVPYRLGSNAPSPIGASGLLGQAPRQLRSLEDLRTRVVLLRGLVDVKGTSGGLSHDWLADWKAPAKLGRVTLTVSSSFARLCMGGRPCAVRSRVRI